MDQQNITASDVIISVKDLKKYYNEGAVKALDGITTDIRRGEVTVIIGPSGSGKSTFCSALWSSPLPAPFSLTEPTSPTRGSISTGIARKWAWFSSISISFPT